MYVWYAALAIAALGVLAAGGLFLLVRSRPAGTPAMQAYGAAVRTGAYEYLKAQYTRLGGFCAAVALLLLWVHDAASAGLFLLGAMSSAATGFAGMLSATGSNVRTCEAARLGDARLALRLSVLGAAPLGLGIASLGLLGVCGISLIAGTDSDAIGRLWIFSLGASATALFARIGGGIYTKAADVGADLVGKIEQGIPEDDPRNPGVVADSVGDVVGDVAGMGADLFESYVGSIVAALTIAAMLAPQPGVDLLAYPLLLAALGLAASLIGIAAIHWVGRMRGYQAMAVAEILTQGVFLTAVCLATVLLGFELRLLIPVFVGTVTGFLIGRASTWYTSGVTVRRIVEASRTGPATNVIVGIATGFEACAVPLVVLAVAVIAAHAAYDVYGVAIAGVSMLAAVGMLATIDSSGPIADNAGGIAKAAELGAGARAITDELDALGNTTAANGKGFAIGSAALTALGLFYAFESAIAAAGGSLNLDISEPEVLAGALLGAAVVVMAASLTLRAVGSAASRMVEEIRRQFRETPGLLEGRTRPDSVRCIAISTNAALDRMLAPAGIAVLAPILVGFALGPLALAGMLIGSLLVGVVLALFMANAGGAWDNAKKLIERGLVEGAKEGDAVHAATVIGDTVGDPFKDTTGPSMNILIKVIAIVALVITPMLV